MSISPQIALHALIAALEEHLAAAASRRGDNDPAVEAAYLAVADAFDVYEEVLFDHYNEVTPLVIYDDDDEDELDEDSEIDNQEADEPDIEPTRN